MLARLGFSCSLDGVGRSFRGSVPHWYRYFVLACSSPAVQRSSGIRGRWMIRSPSGQPCTIAVARSYTRWWSSMCSIWYCVCVSLYVGCGGSTRSSRYGFCDFPCHIYLISKRAAPAASWCAHQLPRRDCMDTGVAFPPGRCHGELAVAPCGLRGESASPPLQEAAALPHSC